MRLLVTYEYVTATSQADISLTLYDKCLHFSVFKGKHVSFCSLYNVVSENLEARSMASQSSINAHIFSFTLPYAIKSNVKITVFSHFLLTLHKLSLLPGQKQSRTHAFYSL